MSAPAASPAAAPDAALVLATHNAGKLTELRAILEPLAPDLDPRSIISAASLGVPEPVEDGLTFAANAEIKACCHSKYPVSRSGTIFFISLYYTGMWNYS